MRRIMLLGLLLISIAGAAMPAAGQPSPSWLDDPDIRWNEPGDAILPAPDGMGGPPWCTGQVREPETDADRQVVAAGWKLILGYESGWGTTIVRAAGGFDANCRASPYTAFFFVDGIYAGRSAPLPDWPRTDGALESATISQGGSVYARYQRYGPNTAMCCPDATTNVFFGVERTPDGPVMQPGPNRTLVAPDGQIIFTVTPVPGDQTTP